jgi:homogentisate 1,2-dioxygenase
VRVFSREKHNGQAEREILVPVYGYHDFQNPSYMVSRHLLVARIAATGTAFSPLPCKAWHGYMVTIAHRVEVEVGVDGPASAETM